MHSRVKRDLIALARAAPTEETCALIYADASGLAAHVCRNVAADRAEEFEIAPADHIAALQKGRLFGVYHSIPESAAFSPADLDNAEELCLPYHVYSVVEDQWLTYVPRTYDPPLERRPFVLGEWDCYGLVRDWYRTKGHHMGDYDRDESFCHEEQGVIMESFAKEGFALAEGDWAAGDVLMYRTEKALPQHFGIYLGGNRMLHHPQGGLSCVEQVSDRWLSRLVCRFRRKPASVPV